MPITSYPQSFKEKLIAYYKLCINEVFDNITDDQLFSKNLTALLPNKVYFTKQVATHFNISYDETLYFLKGNYYLTEAKKLIYLKRGKIVYTEYTKNKSFDTLIQRTGLSKVQLYPFYRFY